MGIPRFYISPKQWNLDSLALVDPEAHHCQDVMRMKEGDRVVVFDGRGHEATAKVATLSKGRVALKVLHHARSPQATADIVLGQAIPKGKNMDVIIEKATELGAVGIIPLISERTIVRLTPDEARDRREKWQRVAIEAAKQCGRNWLPEVRQPITLKAYFESAEEFDLMLVASLQPDARHLKVVLHDLAGDHPLPHILRLRRVLVLIGPEGDFTPAEIALAKSAGCRPITLGPIILRTETAAIYCLSVLSHEVFAPA
jgi:16S rRNA (uracil1498-N3)-methyltransferase